jgi:protein-tyrosine phosphatase
MLSNDPSHPFALEADPKVKARNRYINVQAWANCRIHLRVPGGECDFINASPIILRDTVTEEERRYIATQVGDSSQSLFVIDQGLLHIIGANRSTGP